MKDMEDFIITLLKDVNDLLYGKAEEPETEECPSDEFGNTWQSRARRLQEDRRRLRSELDAALVRIEALQAEVVETENDAYQRGYNDAKNYFRMMQKAFKEKVEILEAEVLAIDGEREYFKSRVDVLNTEIDILNAEVERLTEELSKSENVSTEVGVEITEEPAPWSSIRLMDMDGDLWASMTTINGRLWHCETVAWAQPLSFNDLKNTYGPLYLPPHRSK